MITLRVGMRAFGGLAAAIGLAALGGVVAVAADLGGDCCADLEERVAELEATTARKGNRKVSLTISGWVNQALLSGRRTAQVLPWDVKAGSPPPKLELKADDSERATATALVEAGVIANLQSCDSRWCYVTVETFRGYIEQGKLWGIYPGEIIK